MKLANALKLANKWGKVESSPSGFRHTVKMRDGRIVTFYTFDNQPAGNIHTVCCEYYHPYIVHRHSTLSMAIASALDKMHRMECGEKRVTIQECYTPSSPHNIRRTLAVMIDGEEVCGRPPEFLALTEKAIETGIAGPLTDWVEEHYVDRIPGTILI